MAKNIVILLDGTSNEIKTNRTNVLRMYGTLQKSPEQLVYYDPGVGTFGAENAWSQVARKGVEVWGMATGWGLDTNIKEAYRFLVQNYGRDADGTRDRIYICGFSRGAYSARVLAGFIHAFGLMEPRNLNLLGYAYRAYKRIGLDEKAGAFDELRLFERVLRADRPPIRFLGLFDTVASVIEAGRYGPRLHKHAFTRRNPSVESVRHAVAIAERRTMFRPELWSEDQAFKRNRFDKGDGVPQDTREVWFAGVHGDVGGGYAEAESGLGKWPLKWMIDHARETGMEFKTRTVNELVLGLREDKSYVPPSVDAKPHDSMKPAWRALEYVPRRKPAGSRRADLAGWIIPRAELRWVPRQARVHHSVPQWMAATGETIENLPKHYEIEMDL